MTDATLAVSATGLLADFNRAGVLVPADVHVASRLAALTGETDQTVLLGAALAVRAVRHGSVCLQVGTAAETIPADESDVPLAWPEAKPWREAMRRSPLVAVDGATDVRPLRLVGDLLYLDRYWRQEQVVRAELESRSRTEVPVDEGALRASLSALFPADPPDRQRLAAAMTALSSVAVVAGGPGTGKTTTVALLLELLHQQPGPAPRIALAAPTGKAAARLQEAVAGVVADRRLDIGPRPAVTIHRLLGRRPDSRSRFRYDRGNRLPYDVVVVDETSMVSLTLMSRLLEALRPDARLVLVGDPDQLASVEAGAVLGDLVERPAPADRTVPALLTSVVGADLDPDEDRHDPLRNGVVRLTRTHRFGVVIGRLATAIRTDDADGALDVLTSGDPAVSFVAADADGQVAEEPLRSAVVDAARGLHDAAVAGDTKRALELLDRHRMLCAHRRGPFGVARWAAELDRWVAEAVGVDPAGWYPGRALLVTENDYELQVFNGDTGVVVEHPERGLVAAFRAADGPLLLSPQRLSSAIPVSAMTVHRAQGSQFDTVAVLLPPPESPLLTRELFYTAVTRAAGHVQVIGSEASVRAAIERRIARASGLRHHQ